MYTEASSAAFRHSVLRPCFTCDLVQLRCAGSPAKEGFYLVRSMVDWPLKTRDLHLGVSVCGMAPEPREFPEHRFKEVVSWET